MFNRCPRLILFMKMRLDNNHGNTESHLCRVCSPAIEDKVHKYKHVCVEHLSRRQNSTVTADSDRSVTA